ncbi:phosphotransferase [Vibrio penaeicida]|uniref:phosphotransferase n=1 Tax=Vibrio penaeicida TaxID=104609 RepID=UPI0027358F69|nr:phosphotransferase [Vibrio penaeicida]MDP2571963.1 phosphotransferase [Vibrio penaeicida]
MIPPSLTNALISDYQLEIKAIEPLTKGRAQLYKLRDAHGEWVVKYQSSPPFTLSHEAEIYQCMGLSYCAPKITIHGNSWVSVINRESPFGESTNQGYVLVRPFIEGKHPDNTPSDFFLLGQSLAELHAHFDRIPTLKTRCSEFNTKAQIQQCEQFVRSDSTNAVHNHALPFNAPALFDGIWRAYHSSLLQGDQKLQQDPNLKQTQSKVCIGDAHRLNCMVTPQHEWLWMDFEDAVLAPREYDLATMIWSTLSQRLSSPLWHAGLSGYLEQAQAPEEIDLSVLPLLIVIRQCWWLNLHYQKYQAIPDKNIAHKIEQGLQLLSSLCKQI